MKFEDGHFLWPKYVETVKINIVQRIGRDGLCIHYRVQNSPQTVPTYLLNPSAWSDEHCSS